MVGLLCAELLVLNAGDTHAAVSPADISTQIQTLMVTSYVTALSLAAGPMSTRL